MSNVYFAARCEDCGDACVTEDVQFHGQVCRSCRAKIDVDDGSKVIMLHGFKGVTKFAQVFDDNEKSNDGWQYIRGCFCPLCGNYMGEGFCWCDAAKDAERKDRF